jgi:hypothetical protein
MLGGLINLTMESTKSTELLQRSLNTDPKYPTSHPDRPISGSIEVCDPEDGKVIRRLAFEEAFIVQIGEALHGDSWLPMMETITISPLRLDINRTIRLVRRWPQAPHGWQRYVEKKPVAVMTKENEPTFTIVDAYWVNRNGYEIRDLNVKVPVTLYVEIEEEDAIGRTVSLVFEDKGEDGIKRFECSGIVGANRIITIEHFKLEPVKEEEQ